MLAVSATLSGGDLLITYNAPGDLSADISFDGAKYTVSGTGLASKQFNVADVTGVISVNDKAGLGGQEFEVLAGTALANPLQVKSNVEITSLNGGIVATKAGNVLIGSSAITLAADIKTTATSASVLFSGAVTLANDVTVDTGSGPGDITFQSTVDGAKVLNLGAGTGAISFAGKVGNITPLEALQVANTSSTTFGSTLSLDGGGLVIGKAANNVTLNTPGSTIKAGGFSSGIWFKGGSLNSTISGVTIEGGSNGILVEAGVYTGTVIQANTIKDNFFGIYLSAFSGPSSIENLTIGGDKTAGLGNLLTNNGDGFHIDTGDFTGTKIIGNTISLSGSRGIYLHAYPDVGTATITNLTIGAGLFGDGSRFGNRIEKTTAGAATGIAVDLGVYTGTVIGGGNEITENTYGIVLLGGGDTEDLTIAQNAIGTLLDLTTDRGNTLGIQVNAGGYTGTVIQSNAIAFNDEDGIRLSAAGGAITNLTIGGDKTVALSEGNWIYENDSNGIQASDGDYTGTVIQGNLLDSNISDGIYLNAAGVTLTNLTIGAGVGALLADQARFGNRMEFNLHGVHVTDGDFLGTVIAGGNEIGLSDESGIYLEGDVLQLTIAENFIGTWQDGITDRGNVLHGIQAEAGDYTGTVIQSNAIAFNGVDGIRLSAAGGAITNLTIGGDKTVALSEGNWIYENDSDGIQADDGDYTGTVIQGNYLDSNIEDGIYLNAAGGALTNLTIGAGVAASLADQARFGNRMEFNFHGVHVTDGIFNGTVIAGGNEIGLSDESGIYLEGDVLQLTIAENFIGTWQDGTTDRGNLLHGIEAEAGDYTGTVIQSNAIAFNNVDGIRLAAAGDKVTNLTINDVNTIYANDSDGIQAENGDYAGTVIQTNVIFSNAVEGIYLAAAGDKITNLTIGGDKTAVPSEGNLIFSNFSDGIQADVGNFTGTVIQGNQIGSPSESFTLAAGASTVTFAGDLTGFLFPSQAIFLKPTSPAPAVGSVKRVIVAVALVGGNTQVTLSAPIDATTTGGTAVVGNLANGIFLNTNTGSLTNLTIGGGVGGASKFANEIFANTENGILVGPGVLAGTVIGERNEITRNGTNGIELVGGVQDLLIQRNLIGLKSDNKAGNGNTLAGIYATAGDYGPSIPGAAGTKIVLNTIGYNGTNGIELEGARNLTVGGLPQTNGNTILRNTLAGVLASGDSAGTTIKSNLIDRNKFGVQLDNATGILVGGTTSQDTNTITGNTAAGVEATGLLTGSQVYRNVISGSTTGVSLIDARDLAVGGFDDKTKVSYGNQVFSNTQGLTAQGDSAGTNVVGNSFTGNDVGAQLVAATGLTIGAGDRSNPLSRNVFDANPIGVQASGLLTATTVHGNIIKNGVTGVSLDNAQGILIGGGAPYVGPPAGSPPSKFANSIESQSTNGVYATGSLAGSKVQGNQLDKNYVGVTLDSAENLLVDSNSILNGSKTGISAFGKLAGTTVSNNALSANKSGIVLHDLNGIGEVLDLTVTGNTIEDSILDGIFATGNLAGTTVTSNTVNRSGVSGISLVSAQNLPVSANIINDSKKDGLVATGDLIGSSVTGNTINRSAESGIALVSAANLPLSGNEVNDSGKNGVYATGDLLGTSVKNNAINRSGESGVTLESATNLAVTSNTVADSVKVGLFATGDSSGTEFKNNVVSKSGTDGAVLEGATNLLVTANEFNDSGNRGLFATGDLFGTKVTANTINRSQGDYATVFKDAQNLLFKSNEINDSVQSGLYATGDLFGTSVEASTINRTKGGFGAVLDSAMMLTVTTTEINDSAQGGLYATGNLSGTVVQNSAVNRSQGDFAVVLQAAQNLEVFSNSLADNAKSGLFASGDLSGTRILSNAITNTGTVAETHVSAALVDARNLVFGDVGVGNTVTGGTGAGLFTSGNLLGTTVKGNLFDGTRSGIVLSNTQNGAFGGAGAGEGNTVIGGGSLPLGQYRDGIFAAGNSAGSTLTGTVIQDAWIGVSLNWVENLTVTSTTVTNQQGIGLFAQGTNTGATVTNMGVVRTAAPTLDTSGAVLNAATGLTLSNSQFEGDTTGLFVFEEAANTRILQSSFAGLTSGVGLFSARNLVFGLIGQGNTVTGGQTGGFVSGGMSGTAITGNSFRALGAGGTALGLVSATNLRVASNTITGSGVGLYTNGSGNRTSVMSNLIDGNVTGFSITATRNLTFGSFSERNTITNSSFAGIIASGNCIGSVVLFTNWGGNATNVIDNASPPLVVSPLAP